MKSIYFSRSLRIISTIILAFFLWTFGGLFDVAYAVKISEQQSKSSAQSSAIGHQQTKKSKSEEKFGKDMEDLGSILKDAKTDHETKKNKLRSKKAEIDADDIEIRKQFKETEDKIKDLPEVIRQRHRDFVKKYEENLNELRANLEDIDKAKTKEEIDSAMVKTKAFLDKTKPPKKKSTLDPNKLPHRSAEPGKIDFEEMTPSQAKALEKEYAEAEKYALSPAFPEPKGIQVASIGSLSGILTSTVVQATNPPTSADLAETIEVKFTPAITAKAQELNYNPVKIYEYVRNNIEYVPTYGSIQGADMCLQTKLCNDFDTASLLIALLRASGIHAKYASGTIQLPIEKVKNWMGGFTDSMEALRLLASTGVPTKGLTEGGQIKYVQIEHVWVEAYIDYMPSRGARHKNGQGDTWIRLDGSFKQYTYTQGMDIKSAVPFDAQTFIDQIKNTATINETQGYVTNVNSLLIQQTMTDYQTQVQNYISQNYPNATVGDVLGKKEIVKQEFPYLLGTLPYKTVVNGITYSSIPDIKRHKLSFSVIKDAYDEITGTPINITKTLPELAGKKITLSYSPATQADENVINSYLPKPHTDGTPIQPNELPSSLPAYLINLKPELRIDGQVAATGTSVVMGNKETFTMTFSGPGLNANDIITNDVTSGQYLGIGLDLGRISQEQMTALKTKLEATKAKLEAQNFDGITKDDILGDLLYITALSYHAELEGMNYVVAREMGVIAIILPSETIFSYELNSNYAFGIPISVNSGGLAMDADRLMTHVKALDGDVEKPKQFLITSGMNSSILEHQVPEQLFSTDENPAQGISALKALQIANSQGIPIYTINQSNINSIFPQLQVDSGTLSDIRNAVNAGKLVIVSKTEITYSGWTGCGYIIADPTTGAGAYMISGGMNGAVIYSLWWVGYVILLTLQYAGFIAIGWLAAIVLGPILFAIEGLIASIFASSAQFIAKCIQKAMNAGTLGAAIQAIAKLPKRLVDGLQQGGWAVALTYVSLQLAKIWSLTCGQPG